MSLNRSERHRDARGRIPLTTLLRPPFAAAQVTDSTEEASPATVATPPPESLAGQTVWVVDAHSLIHQVFHAIPDMTSPSGQPVNAVYGFTRDLFYLLESKQPDFLFCAFDLPGKTFRHQLYEQYKAGRPDMHEDLVPQIDYVHRMVDALGIPLLAYEGFEADDVVATVARLTDELGGRCFIVSGDKDCRQLITEHVKLYNIRKNEVIDREVLRQEWGVSPNQVVDYQALVGDSTDNVPGVPLIGPKAARDLLEKYGTLENILAHVDEVSGAAKKENLKKYRGQALLSRKLVKLDAHVPLAISWRSARPGHARGARRSRPGTRAVRGVRLPPACRAAGGDSRHGAGRRRGPGRQANRRDDRYAQGPRGPRARNAAAEADFGRYGDDAHLAPLGRTRGNFVFLE